MYIDNNPILHVVDEETRFQAARWLQNISAKHIWDAIRACWIDVYIGPPDYIVTDAGSNFTAKEFHQSAASMAISVKNVPVEAHWSIGIVERHHSLVRRVYKIIAQKLAGAKISKEFMLQISIKANKDTAGPNGLVPTLLVFGAYPQMTTLDPPNPSVIQRSMAMQKAMNEIRKFRAEKQVNSALKERNGPNVEPVHNLPANSDVLV